MAKIGPEWLGPYLDKGIDLRNRSLCLIGDIDEDSFGAFFKGLRLLETTAEEPLTVYISTEGGEIYDMFGIYDLLRNSRCYIRTVSIGKVMSAGILLAAAGDERYCYPNTIFMSHEASWTAYKENLTSQKLTMKHMLDWERRWADCMEEQTGTPASTWLRIHKGQDLYLTADQAVELGIVEKIIA